MELKELLELYLLFFKMGAVTFGGGYAMLPILRREIVHKRAWMAEEKVMDFYAVSQGLPGIIAINVSCFIGYQRRRVKGAVAAALGMVSPSILIITLIAAVLVNFQNEPLVRSAFSAISICVCALILDAVIGMWKKGVKDVFGIFLFAAMFALAAFTRVSPILLVVVAAILGVAKKEVDEQEKRQK